MDIESFREFYKFISDSRSFLNLVSTYKKNSKVVKSFICRSLPEDEAALLQYRQLLLTLQNFFDVEDFHGEFIIHHY